MRKIILATGILAAALSCTQATYEYVDYDTFRVTSVNNAPVAMPDGTINPEIRFMEDPEPDTRVASTTVVTMAKDLLGSIRSNDLVHICGTYKGHDIDGSELIQSGKLLLPKDGPVKNLIIVSHFTIGANYECPTEAFPLEGALAAKGYAVAIADYIGFGITSARIHPYMHVESTARSVVDMALAVKPYLEHIGRKPESDKVILVGYSQGGSTTMAVMKMIQNEYSGILPIKKVYAGGGPYDLAVTYDYSMELDATGIPCAIPMIVQGVSVGDNLHLNMGDFFQPKLLANYDSWINSKQYTVKEINTLIDAKSLHEIMTAEGRDKTSPQTARLYKALMLNSVLNFYPEAPVYMFHSQDDETVPFANALRAEQYFKGTNIHFDFNHYGKHGTGCVRFLIKVSEEL